MTYDMKLNYDTESQQPYFKTITELLDKYEDGWDVFVKAHEAKDYDIPVPRKEEFKDDPYLPDTWLALADKVISIIAHEKLGLETNPNRIEIVRADQMLDAYVKPVPDGPPHWSYGKRRFQEQQQFDANKHLAYEIIINSVPALAYCMDTNSPVMQMLVFAHASYGHNAFYKNNYLFQEQTDADTILAVNQRLRNLVEECEEKFGIEEVEQVLDFCHAMRFMDTSINLNKKFTSNKDSAEKAKKARDDKFLNPPRKSIFNGKVVETNDNSPESRYPGKGRDNILNFIAENVDHIPQWKREIMKLSSATSQNFLPNIKTKVANEAMACITHFQTMDTLNAIGLINADMYAEFRKSHAGVLHQNPGYVVRKNQYTGEEEKVPTGQDMNIYALGFAIMEDVRRICEEPTEEDKRWFPNIAGKGDWVNTCNDILYSSSDETLVRNFMSPTVMRKFKFFLLEGDMRDEFLEVSAVHADDGFMKIREQLAADYRLSDVIPKVTLKDYQYETDRCLVLQHDVINEQKLEPKSLQMILEMIHHQTKHPVVMESVNSQGKVVASYASPPGYKYMEHSPAPLRQEL